MTLDQKIEAMRTKVKTQWRPRYDLCESIQAAAIAVFGVEKESFFNGERTREVASARMASMALCRELTELSLQEIGMLHGGMDHTSVSYAVRKFGPNPRDGYEPKKDLILGFQEIRQLIGQQLTKPFTTFSQAESAN